MVTLDCLSFYITEDSKVKISSSIITTVKSECTSKNQVFAVLSVISKAFCLKDRLKDYAACLIYRL